MYFDTVHAMPGEIFVFLTILPYLNDGAVCIIHDIANLNIGAFVVDNKTRGNIANVFSSLSVTWTYEPTIRELMA